MHQMKIHTCMYMYDIHVVWRIHTCVHQFQFQRLFFWVPFSFRNSVSASHSVLFLSILLASKHTRTHMKRYCITKQVHRSMDTHMHTRTRSTHAYVQMYTQHNEPEGTFREQMHAHMHIYTCECTHKCTYTHANACTHAHIHMRMHAHMHIYTCECTHKCTYTHTNAYTHAYIHIWLP